MSKTNLQPNPKNAPVCCVCKAPYVLAWIDNGVVAGMWLWKRDCKHRRSAEIVAGDAPEPKVWPFCSACEARYVLRRALLVGSGKWQWIWQRGCKHRTAAPQVGKKSKKSTKRKK